MIWKFFSRGLGLPKNYKEKIDSQALDIVRELQKAGHRAYLVGGCVRDILLGIPPKDFDIATSANPYLVKSVIHRSQIIGKRFRIVVARRKKSLQGTKQYVFPPLDRSKHFLEIQITTFRRAPEKTLTGTLDENVFGNEKDDSERRDFTLNGLFLDPFKGKVVDYVSGQKDISLKQIRTIGEANARFEEDPVRMLRALRFMIRIGFHLEKSTEKALRNKASTLLNAKKERVREEFLKMAREGYLSEYLKRTHEYGLLKYVSPALDRYWTAKGHELPNLIKKIDEAVKKYPWPNQHLSAPFFFVILMGLHDNHFQIHSELESVKEDFLISKAEMSSVETFMHILNRMLKGQRWNQRLVFLTRRNIETQSQFFFVLKLLAECYGAPYDKVWESNEELWRDMKNRHFARSQRF